MKTFWYFLKIVALAPVLPIIGIPGSDDEEKPGKQDAEDKSSENMEKTGEEEQKGQETGGDKPVNLTQKELDALIDRAFKKGARKATAGTGLKKPTEGQQESLEADVEERMKAANDRLLEGTVRGLAADLGMTAKGAKAAAKLADFSGCFNQAGDLDDEAVKDALEDFLKEYPEFKQQKQEEKGGFKVGADDPGSRPSSNQISEIFGNKSKGA
ncbi:hypothetical protein [Ligaoa zhengdingensis]|jgi:hypothetical protein|uniref:hypothetical protein n=1 Tax=Ligaoa zhengdingensis TaxID=2763658 RepID=UPI0020526026|nr:MAG TPA: hypothetical protein [Caudoviricetes sp.]